MQAPVIPESNFSYRCCRFNRVVERARADTYVPRARYLEGLNGVEVRELQQGSDPYGAKVEALRHAEQQALGWADDRAGDGYGESQRRS